MLPSLASPRITALRPSLRLSSRCFPTVLFSPDPSAISISSKSPSTMTYSTSSPRPPWLTSFLNDTSAPPRIYSWTPDSQPKPAPVHDPRRIFILGVGNIGRLYAVHLTRHHPNPPPITLVLHRQELLTDWASNPGIEITRDGGNLVERTTKGLDVEYWTATPPTDNGSCREIGPINNLLVTTKAEAALPEADRLRRYLTSSSTVAFAQNGMSKLWPPHGEAYTTHRWPDGEAPSFAACITTHGIISLGPFRSLFASPADAKVGMVLPSPSSPDGKAGEYLVDVIANAPGLNSKRVSRSDLWILQLEKLVVNAVINPMTALLRCKNGVLFARESGILVEIMDRLLQQISAVYRALVNHPSTAPIIASAEEDETLEQTRRRLEERFAFAPLREMLWKVGYQVTENNSSMLQDVRAGKPTEIRDFNGWIVDMARFLSEGDKQQKLDVSSHQTLVDLVESGKTLNEAELGKAIL